MYLPLSVSLPLQLMLLMCLTDCDDLQASEVSSSKPSIIANEVLGPLLLEALDGFLFVVNQDGKIEFVSENVNSFLNFKQSELTGESIYQILASGDHARFSSNLLPMSAIGMYSLTVVSFLYFFVCCFISLSFCSSTSTSYFFFEPRSQTSFVMLLGSTDPLRSSFLLILIDDTCFLLLLFYCITTKKQ